MKKVIFIALAVMIAAGAFSQVSGKYTAEKLVTNHDTIADTLSVAYPIEISGDNYLWQISSKWKGTSVVSTSMVKCQYSPDGSLWFDVDTASLKLDTLKYFTGTDTPFRYMRLKLDITAGDTVYGYNAWCEFRRK